MIVMSLLLASLAFACLGAGWVVAGPQELPGGRGPRFDGLVGLIGLAVLTWLGGWLVLAGAYSKQARWGLVALGCCFWLARLARRVRGGARPTLFSGGLPVPALSLGLISLVLAAGRVVSEFAVPFFNLCDDLPSYFHFPRLLLESGSFIEPFSLRRLNALGATPLLQGYFANFSVAAAGITDALIGQFLLWAIAREIPDSLAMRPQPAWIGQAFGCAALLVSLALPVYNAMPVLLPMAGGIGLILLTRCVATAVTPVSGARAALAWGFVAAWLLGLRTMNLLFPAGLWIVGAIAAGRSRDRTQWARLLIAALTTVVALLPWSLTLWRSSGTPLFPFVNGNFQFVGLVAASAGTLYPESMLRFILDCLWTSRVWIVIGIGGLIALRSRFDLLTAQVMFALFLLVMVTAGAMTAFDSFHVYRYDAPFIAAGLVFFVGSNMFAGAAAARDQPARLGQRQRLSGVLMWAALALWILLPVKFQIDASPGWLSNMSMAELSTDKRVSAALQTMQSGFRVAGYPGRADYEAAQSRLSPDARVVSAAEYPFHFRFDRQVIHTLDMLGLVSPPPGMPFFQGPEPLVAYFRELGYTHLAVTPPEAGVCLYSRARMSGVRSAGFSPWDGWAILALDFMDNAERLAADHPVVYRSPELVLIDLR